MKKRNLRELLESLLQKNHYSTVPELLAALTAKGLRFNKTSVYRSLEKMSAEGSVCRHSFGTDKVYYELRHPEHEHHDHFVCELCKKISLLECSVTHTAVPAGYSVEHHHLTVFGKCDRCVQAT